MIKTTFTLHVYHDGKECMYEVVWELLDTFLRGKIDHFDLCSEFEKYVREEDEE